MKKRFRIPISNQDILCIIVRLLLSSRFFLCVIVLTSIDELLSYSREVFVALIYVLKNPRENITSEMKCSFSCRAFLALNKRLNG
jgi:hypothetical protein